jgi:large subunit ribosomal protein L15
MMIHDITVAAGKNRRRTRIGRGRASGLGKSAGRGQAGAQARSGWKHRYDREGGQMSMFRRIPKRGFSNFKFEDRYHVVNVKSLEGLPDGATVTIETLAEAGVVRDAKLPLKVLGEGDLSKRLAVTAAKFSGTARQKIEAAGGSVTVVVKRTWKRDRTPRNGKDAKAGKTAAER